MSERWLYGLDGGLREPEDAWEPDPWVEGVPTRDGRPSSGLGSLTEIVLIDGQVVDSRRRPVSGSGYECAALELGHAHETVTERRVERLIVREEPQEEMLHWLDRVVGGPDLLDSLEDRPLPLREPLDLDLIAVGDRDLACAVDDHLDLVGKPIVPDELLTAYRRLLVRAGQEGMLRLWRDVPPHKVAAAIVHCVVRANALTGTAAPFSVSTFLRDLGGAHAPSSRSRSLALVVGGTQWPHGRAPSEAPGVYVLGDVRFLVSRFRNELMTYRDLARVAEAARAGEVAG